MTTNSTSALRIVQARHRIEALRTYQRASLPDDQREALIAINEQIIARELARMPALDRERFDLQR